VTVVEHNPAGGTQRSTLLAVQETEVEV